MTDEVPPMTISAREGWMADLLQEALMPPPEELTLVGRVGNQEQYKDKQGRIYYVIRRDEANDSD